MTEPDPQELAREEVDGVKTVTVEWDDDEWTFPAYEALMADQVEALEDYLGAKGTSVRVGRTFMRSVLGPEQYAATGFADRINGIVLMTKMAEFFAVMAEDGWGLGKASNRRERRSGRTTKR